MAKEKAQDSTAVNPVEAAPAGPKIRWDDTHMQTAYANICNGASTRESVSRGWPDEMPALVETRSLLDPTLPRRWGLSIGLFP